MVILRLVLQVENVDSGFSLSFAAFDSRGDQIFRMLLREVWLWILPIWIYRIYFDFLTNLEGYCVSTYYAGIMVGSDHFRYADW